MNNKRKDWMAAVVALIGISVSIASVFVACYVPMSLWAIVGVVVLGLAVMMPCLAAAVIIDHKIGCYECQNCHERFVPEMKAYIWGVHGISWRRLKCPRCGVTTNCTRHIDNV